MDPTSQFIVHKLYDMSVFGVDISITNSSFSMLCCTLCISILMTVASLNTKMIPGFVQNAAEMVYGFLHDMVRQHGGVRAVKYLSLVGTIFFTVLFGNLLGLVPGFYTFTSQLIITLFMALSVFFSVIIIGLREQGLGFFRMFMHSGIPLPIGIFMLPIEVVSFFARPVSLCLRLCINMIAGHMMLKIFASFASMLPVSSVFIIPLLVVLTLFELLVAVLQAYIFALLTCIYLHDAVLSHIDQHH